MSKKNSSYVIISLVVIAALFSSGCGKYQFQELSAIGDDDFYKKAMKAYKPVVILFHDGLDSGSTHDWGGPLEKYAQLIGDRVEFYHYNSEKNQEWHRKLGLHFVGIPLLLVNGEVKGLITSRMPNEKGRIGQLFMLLHPYVFPEKSFSSFKRRIELAPKFFETDVINSEKPVLVAFDRCSSGG